MKIKHFLTPKRIFLAVYLLIAIELVCGQMAPGYSVATPRPISPAEGTTNPSAQATQSQNPYLGSIPGPATEGKMELSLQSAIQRGLRYNLGLIESDQASADVRAARVRALALLLPQISAQGRLAFEKISFKEIGIKLPPSLGLTLPPTSSAFGYQDTRIILNQSVWDPGLRAGYLASKRAEEASRFSFRDSRDVVVFAVATAYLQVIADAARVEATKAQLLSARELNRQTADRVTSELSPEIDSLRAQVQMLSAEQRLTNVLNQMDKDKLTLARVTGLSVEQEFVVTDALLWRPPTKMTQETATQEALRSRADLASSEASVKAAEATLRAQRDQRLPVVSVSADYGGAGANAGNFNQVYSVSGSVSVPIYTGGRIRADIDAAQSELVRRRAEYDDLKGRIAYDIRVAWLDVSASDSSIRVAERNDALAARALLQAEDRYAHGVTNYLEVVQAQEEMAAAHNNRIDSLYSFNVALVALSRALGDTETRLRQLLGGN